MKVTATTPDLENRILALSDDASLEALNLLAGEILGAKTDSAALDEVSEAIGVSTTEVSNALSSATPLQAAEFSRLTLLAAVDNGHATVVAAAVDAVGQKAFIVEVAIIGVLALAILHTIYTKGAKSTSSVTKITTKPDGTVTRQVTEKAENFSVGGAIAPLAKRLLDYLS
jgi:hypothetical protein